MIFAIVKKITTLFVFVFLTASVFAGKNKIDSLENVIKTQGNDTLKVKTLNNLCAEYQNNNPKRLQECAAEAIEISQLLDYTKGEGDAYAHLGVLFKNQGLYDTAQACHNRALMLFKSINSNPDISRTLSNLGIVQKELGNFDAALKFYMAALTLIDENKDKKNAAKIYSNIGIVYKHLKQYHKAMEYFLMTLKSNVEMGDSMGIGRCYNNIASAYSNMNMLDSALFYINRSNAIRERFGDKLGLAIGSSSSGDIYMQKKDPDQALYYYEKSMKLYLELEDNDGYGSTLASIGKTQFAIGQYKKALDSYKSALSIYEKIKKREDIMDICVYISEVLEKLNRPAEALAYLKRHIELKDSLFDANIMRQTNDLEQKYQAEKKQAEIEELLKNQSIQELKNNRLQMFVYAGIAVLLLVTSTFLFLKIKKQRRMIVNQKSGVEKSSQVG